MSSELDPKQEAIKQLLVGVIKNHKRMLRQVWPAKSGSGLCIATQAPIQTNPFGKLKFETGRETAYLGWSKGPRSMELIARVTELPNGEVEFEDYKIGQCFNDMLPDLRELQTAVSKH